MAERKNSEKRIASNNRWTNAHYDRVNLAIPKGRKDSIKAHADIRGESINGFIWRAVQEAIERDTGAAGDPQGAVAVSLLYPDTIKGAQEAAEAAGETVPQFIDRAVEETADMDAATDEMKFSRAVDVVAARYEVSCWDVLKELDRMKAEREGGKPNE